MNRTSDLFLRIAAVVAFTVGSSAVFNIGTASQGVALPGPGQATTSGVKGPPGDASSNTPNPKVFVSDENLEAYAAACEKERLAANKVYQLKGAVLEDQNQIRALGFDRDSQKFEEMEKTAKERRSQFYLGIVRTMLGQIAETTRGLDGEMTRTQAIAYKNLFHGRAPAAEQVIDKAIRDAGTAEKIHVGPSGMHELVESVDHTWDAANLATSPANIGDVVHNGITVAQVMGLPAPFATLLDGATDLGQLAWDTHEANKGNYILDLPR